MDCLIGIDSGLTVTKAVVFDAAGRTLAVARRRLPQEMPAPRHVERDMDLLWAETAAAIREALAASGRSPGDVAAVAATAHGDGLFVLDRQGRPLGRGILSLDSRASDIVAGWQRDGTAARSLARTGQVPPAYSPAALLAWMARHEPERFARIGHVLSCKDWLRHCLTGRPGTDRTEASTAFTDVATQDYSPDILDLFGLERLAPALPPIAHSAEIVGTVTGEAAALTGLRPGTPVAAGLHDVTASALGIGAHAPGIVGLVAGTYSINEVVSDRPHADPRWLCRNAVEPGLWNAMSISPASTVNYDWMLDTFLGAERARAEAEGLSIHEALAPEIAAALDRPSSILYHPYLFGSPHGETASASLIGLHGWHGRGDVLAAVLEGIAFNHRHHVEALRERFPASEARLTGGASRAPLVGQLFADVLGLPVTVTATDEAAAWGAALCAGAAVGLFARFDADPRDLAAGATTYAPDPARQDHYARRYAVFRDVAAKAADTWDALEALGTADRRPT